MRAVVVAGVAVVLLLAACGVRQAAPASPASATSATSRPTNTLAATASPRPPTETPPALTETLAASPAASASAEPAPASTASPTPDPALAAILSYLDARARADVSSVTGLSCTAWRSQAVTEAISFRSMNAKMQNVLCTVAGSDGPYTLVSCAGKIITTYGAETREWDLSTFTYRATVEAGVWKMCGYH
jgi:hypothetical protein